MFVRLACTRSATRSRFSHPSPIDLPIYAPTLTPSPSPIPLPIARIYRAPHIWLIPGTMCQFAHVCTVQYCREGIVLFCFALTQRASQLAGTRHGTVNLTYCHLSEYRTPHDKIESRICLRWRISSVTMHHLVFGAQNLITVPECLH